jgi:uncharacterized protein (TIGR03083 family)
VLSVSARPIVIVVGSSDPPRPRKVVPHRVRIFSGEMKGGRGMADKWSLWEMVEAERAEFVTLARRLTADEWAAPTLCGAWDVRDVVIHAAGHIHHQPPPWQLPWQLARAGFSVDTLVRRDVGRRRGIDQEALIAWLAAPIKMKRGVENLLAFDTLVQLGELIVHQQDIRRPLGQQREIPVSRVRAVLDFGTTRLGNFGLAGSRRRSAGLCLVATDTDWGAGHGPTVKGSAEALLMAVNGRRDALSDLTGEGTRVLADRLAA